MFIFFGTCVLESIKPFLIDSGKLPSFSISMNNLDLVHLSTLNKELDCYAKVGELNYYAKKNGKFWISFNKSFLCMNNTFNESKIFTVFSDGSSIKRELSDLLMQAYMYRLINTGNMMIHAAAVVYNNQTVLFCGLSGAGKSTQANLWKKYLHARVINYDKPCIIEEDEKFYAHGSPWSGKEALYLNEYYPLKAIVFVVQDTKIEVEKVSIAKAYSLIFLHNYLYPINDEIESKYSEVVSKIAWNIPVYELHCDISENSVREIFEVLFSNENYEKVREKLPMKFKVKDNFSMTKIADEYIVIPRGKEAVDFSATVVFNETGAFLWEKLSDYKTIDELAIFLCEQYSIDKKTAVEDSKCFIDKMDSNGLLDKV